MVRVCARRGFPSQTDLAMTHKCLKQKETTLRYVIKKKRSFKYDCVNYLSCLLKSNSRPPLLRLALARNGTGGAVQVLKREKAVHFHSSTEDRAPPARDSSSQVTTRANGLVFAMRASSSEPKNDSSRRLLEFHLLDV